MNKRQKLQVALIVLWALLLIFWLVSPGNIYARILGVISSALGILLQLLRHHRRERPEAGDGGASRGLIPGKVFRDTPLAPVAEEDFGRRGLCRVPVSPGADV